MEFFHYCPLAINFFKNTADAYEECQVTPVSPGTTKWNAHDRACKSLCDGHKQILSALSICVNKRKDFSRNIIQKVLGYSSDVVRCICWEIFTRISS